MYINNFADKGRQNTIDMLLVNAPLIDYLAMGSHSSRDGLLVKHRFTCMIQSMTMLQASLPNGMWFASCNADAC